MKALKALLELRSFAVPDDLQVKIVHRKDGVDQHYHIRPHQDPKPTLQYMKQVETVNQLSKQSPAVDQFVPRDKEAVDFMAFLNRKSGSGFEMSSLGNPVVDAEKSLTRLDPQSQDYRSLKNQVESLGTKHDFDLKVLDAYRVDYSDPAFDAAAQAYGNVQSLWHGVGNQRAGSLITTGFKNPNDVGSVTGNLFGPGLYFADLPGKAGQYVGDQAFWDSHNTDGIGVLLHADVALGNGYPGYFGMSGLNEQGQPRDGLTFDHAEYQKAFSDYQKEDRLFSETLPTGLTPNFVSQHDATPDEAVQRIAGYVDHMETNYPPSLWRTMVNSNVRVEKLAETINHLDDIGFAGSGFAGGQMGKEYEKLVQDVYGDDGVESVKATRSIMGNLRTQDLPKVSNMSLVRMIQNMQTDDPTLREAAELILKQAKERKDGKSSTYPLELVYDRFTKSDGTHGHRFVPDYHEMRDMVSHSLTQKAMQEHKEHKIPEDKVLDMSTWDIDSFRESRRERGRKASDLTDAFWLHITPPDQLGPYAEDFHQILGEHLKRTDVIQRAFTPARPDKWQYMKPDNGTYGHVRGLTFKEGGGLNYPEFVVYKPEQVKVKHILKVERKRRN